MPQTAHDPVTSIQDTNGWSQRYSNVALIAALTFVARLFAADRNSYWLDELYSVERYVVQFDSLREAISSLAQTSIHPPLYQSILYVWVQIFGDAESVTRTLSNLYVSLSIVAVHQIARKIVDDRTADIIAATYSLTYLVTFYGLETRSYAQTLFLASVSSAALLSFGPQSLPSGQPVEARRLAAPVMLFAGANIGLMLTHYYNFFFLIAQAALVAIVCLTTGTARQRVRLLLTAGFLYLMQFVVFLLVWGRQTLDAYRRNTGRFEADSITNTPLAILDAVTTRSFGFGPVPRGLAFVLVGAAAVVVGLRLWRGRSAPGQRSRLVVVLYLVWISIAPAVVAYVAFLVAGAERLTARYVLYLLPSITILIVLAVREYVHYLSILGRQVTHRSRIGHPPSFQLVVTALLALAIVIPGTLSAARYKKDDWRGYAQRMAAIIESDPDHEYAILEPAFRTTPVFDYYLSRSSDTARVFSTFRRLEERRGENYTFERRADELREYDYIIIPFVHHRTTNFPIALERLSDTYELQYWEIGRDNKGLVIFAVHPQERSRGGH